MMGYNFYLPQRSGCGDAPRPVSGPHRLSHPLSFSHSQFLPASLLGGPIISNIFVVNDKETRRALQRVELRSCWSLRGLSAQETPFVSDPRCLEGCGQTAAAYLRAQCSAGPGVPGAAGCSLPFRPAAEGQVRKHGGQSPPWATLTAQEELLKMTPSPKTCSQVGDRRRK